MAKLPIWAKVEGKWVLFPGHLIETFPNGKQGFVWTWGKPSHSKMWDDFPQFFYDESPRKIPSRILLKEPQNG